MRFLILAHRWMGVALCLFFAAWFLSGAVLIYHPFPSLAQTDRQVKSSEVVPSKIVISPVKALEAVDNIDLDRLRLIDLEGRPVYIFHDFSGGLWPVDAQDGTSLNWVIPKASGRIAENFSGKSVFKVEGPLEYDQWIVPNGYDPYRPLYRISLQDEKDTVLYVSARTGEVLQKTEGTERAWNYMGAIIHWIYPTVLRSNWVVWDNVVWWISLLGVVTAVAGLWLGITRWREAQNANQLILSSPFKGWLRFHHILGLFAGLFVFTWIFSGWLSMDHGRLFSKPNPEAEQIRSYRSITLNQAMESVSLEGLKSLDKFVEMEILAIGGQTFVRVVNHEGSKLYKPLGLNSLLPVILTEIEVIKSVKKAWPDIRVKSTQRPDTDDVYGNLREGSLPKNTLRVMLDDPSKTWIHINMESGQIISVMDSSRRIYRWLFNGLHSLDFPGLVTNRPAWDILILFLLGLGFAFSVTGVVLGWKRLFDH